MKKLLEKILFKLSRAILKKYKPEIIGITGTVGKTSTKDAIYTVLEAKFKRIRQNIKNYNNEIGVPLTIIGVDTGGSNIFKWFYIICKACLMIVFPVRYPKMLVLEMGVDHPGDLSYLLKMAPVNVGVVTAIGEESPVHVEFFKDKAQLVKEKTKMHTLLKKENWALVNLDDPELKGVETKAQKITYSVKEEADIVATDIKMKGFEGLNFKVQHNGNVVPFFLPKVVGLPQVYSTLVAAAVGLAYEMNLVEISEAMKNYKAPKGRLNMLPGIKETVLIDDSYNSSPKACRMALNILSQTPSEGRKMACLGDMAELGKYTEREHKLVGEDVASFGFDYLFCVGEKARDIARGAKKAGMSEDNIFEFKNSVEAGRFIQDRIKQKDLLLIKGSQSVRMEKVAKELMAEPMRAAELLVRQGQGWE